MNRWVLLSFAFCMSAAMAQTVLAAEQPSHDLTQSQAALYETSFSIGIREKGHTDELERQRDQLGVGLVCSVMNKQADLTEAWQRLLENRIRFEAALDTWQYIHESMPSDHQIQVAAQAITLQ